MTYTLKRILCLALMLVFVFNTTVFADDGPHDYEDGTEELYQPNPNARWTAIEAVGMSRDFKILGKAVFSTSVITNDNSYDIKIVTKLQSYRDGTWKTLYTKTKTSTVASTMLSGSYYVTKGYKYRTRNTITVYNASGGVVEQDTLNCTRTYN